MWLRDPRRRNPPASDNGLCTVNLHAEHSLDTGGVQDGRQLLLVNQVDRSCWGLLLAIFNKVPQLPATNAGPILQFTLGFPAVLRAVALFSAIVAPGFKARGSTRTARGGVGRRSDSACTGRHQKADRSDDPAAAKSSGLGLCRMH